MVNTIVTGKTVAGQPSLFTGLLAFFVPYADGEAVNG